ncbi:TRAFAC clade GTPase domain-containing protein [Kitasatospora griseola]|uniref:TRAFAC clade GTPase domain-containing protein n=1 Tax=Kitasatospora griseola TaxID=2064 RepID=UPI00365D7583
MASDIACPYCYETFPVRDILFRCIARPGPTGSRCRAERDQVLEERRGRRGELGPVFAARTRGQLAPCPTCQAVSTFRICPVCHSTLPAQFGLVDNRLIAMVGAKASGKTVYMTVLLHELMNRVGSAGGFALMAADDETMTRFDSDYQDPLYQGGELFHGTRTAVANDHRVDPLVFRFGVERRRLLGARPEHTLLSFFDTAGEDFSSQESVQLNTRYLANADGVILILDPLQLPGARPLARPGSTLPDTAGADSPINVLSRVTSMLLPHRSGPDGRLLPGARGAGRISTPIAVVFAKLDAVWDTLDPGSPLRAHPPGGARFHTADSLDVHEEVRHLLREWRGGSIDQILDANYRHYRYFGISALGNSPTAESQVAPTGIQPYRVTDPLLWLLSEFGSVARQRRR